MDSWLAEYGLALSQLNRENLEELRKYLAEDIEFRDPFNHSFTQTAFIEILDDMFVRLGDVRFEVHRSIQEGSSGVLHWTFHASNKYTGDIKFEGMSHVFKNKAGKVVRHYDHWDGSFLMEKIPLLGRVIRFLRCRMSHQ